MNDGGQVASVVIYLEATDLVVLRTKNPDKSDRAAAARCHAKTQCNGHYQGHGEPANPAQPHALP
jgi:hypothetical protein